LVNVGKVVDGNDSGENDRQFNQAARFPLLLCKLRFPGAKVTRAMRYLLDPFGGANARYRI
jgi:hypothetical protein